MGVEIIQIPMYRHYCDAITVRGYKYRKKRHTKKKRNEKDRIPSVK